MTKTRIKNNTFFHANCIFCGRPFFGYLTQNVKDFLRSPEVANIFENSDFVYMLNQAPDDCKLLADRLHIAPPQLAYITQVPAGEGLLFYGNTLIPFVDHFPKDTELYRIMTTNFREAAP